MGQEELQKRVDQLRYIRHTLRTATSVEEQKDCIGRVAEIAFDFHAKAEQVEAIWRLLIQKQDVVLVAQTLFGKSLIFKMTSVFWFGASLSATLRQEIL